MTRGEYCDRVLACLHRVTGDERQAIRAELEGHMEDHVCALLDLGYPEELAEERTMALMGDPEETGRALDRVYTGWAWVILGRIAFWITALMCVTALLGLGVLFHFWDSVTYRILPPEETELDAAVVRELDIRQRAGNDVLWICRAASGREDGAWVAEVAVRTYDRLPGGIVSMSRLNHLVLRDQRGVSRQYGGRNGNRGSWGGSYSCYYVDIRPGDTYVTLCYDWVGEHFTLDIPLPEEGTP